MNYLGIDVGTGGSRAVLINGKGEILAASTVEHVPFDSPEIGWAEQDPQDWWRAASAAIRDVLAADGVNAEAIGAVSFSGQMHGAVLLDENDEVVRPALIWCDQRTQKQCDEITETVGAARLIELVSNRALTNFTLTKMLWVRENEPENWKKVRTVMLPKDYIRYRLTGDKATDVADASGTLILDVTNRRWSDEILTTFNLDASLMPKLYESTEITGKVSEAGAKETGLAVGTIVGAGAGDNAAGAIGMGIVSPGTASATIGTSGVVFIVTENPTLDPLGRTHTLCHAIPGRWHMTGVTQSAGLSFRWFRENFGADKSYDELVAEASQVPSGSEGAIWLPYLMGERTPHLDPNARAALVGLTASHTRGHAVRAVLEGVAFSLRDSFEIFRSLNVPIESIRLGGGGAKSPLWQQIQADIYGQTVETVAAEEGAAYGAAILAGVCAGGWKTVDEACTAVIKTAKIIEPDNDSADLLTRQFKVFQALYGAIKSVVS